MASLSAGALTLGAAGTLGSITLGGSVSGTASWNGGTTGILTTPNAVSLGSTLNVTGVGTFSNGLTINGGTAAVNILTGGGPTDPAGEVFYNDFVTTKTLSAANNAFATLGIDSDLEVNQGTHNDTTGPDQSAIYAFASVHNLSSTTPGSVANLTGVEAWCGFATGAYGELQNCNTFVRHTNHASVLGQSWMDNTFLLLDVGGTDNTVASINYGLITEGNAWSQFGGTWNSPAPYGNIDSTVGEEVATGTGAIAGNIVTLTTALSGGQVLPNCSKVTGTGVTAAIVTGSSPAVTWYPTYAINGSPQTVATTALTFTCHPPAFVANNYTSGGLGSVDLAFRNGSAWEGYVHTVYNATYGNEMAFGVGVETGKDVIVIKNNATGLTSSSVDIGFTSPTFGHMLEVNGAGYFAGGISGGLLAAATLTTFAAQTAGGSVSLPFATVPGVSVGQAVQGTGIPVPDSVASVVSTANLSFSPGITANAGQAVVQYTGTASNMVGMQCVDVTHPYIAAGSLVSLSGLTVGTSFTLTRNILANVSTSDVIECVPVVTLTTPTASNVGIISVVFANNNTSVSSTASAYTAGDLSVALNANFGGSETVAGSAAIAQDTLYTGVVETTPVTTGTVTFATGQRTALINPAGTIAALTVTLPACATANDGEEKTVILTQIVSALTVNAASGSVVAPPTAATAGMHYTPHCYGAATTWF